MGEESWGIFQQEEFTHVWTKTEGERKKNQALLVVPHWKNTADFISQVLLIYAACFLMGCRNKLCTSGLSMQVSFLLGETCQIFTALSKYNLEEVL